MNISVLTGDTDLVKILDDGLRVFSGGVEKIPELSQRQGLVLQKCSLAT